MKICPHCGFSRTDEHAAVPDWQCPACQRAYQKGAVQDRRTMPSSRPPSRESVGILTVLKWALLLLLVAAAGMSWWRAQAAPRAVAANASAGQPAVTLYATNWCGYCAKTRDFFRANGIRYVEHNIEQDTAARAEHQRLGGRGVPLIVIGDRAIHGYSEAALRAQLAPWMR